MRGGACLGRRSDAAVGVESPDGAIAFLQDVAALFEKGFNLLDERFFVELLARRAVCFVDVLVI